MVVPSIQTADSATGPLSIHNSEKVSEDRVEIVTQSEASVENETEVILRRASRDLRKKKKSSSSRFHHDIGWDVDDIDPFPTKKQEMILEKHHDDHGRRSEPRVHRKPKKRFEEWKNSFLARAEFSASSSRSFSTMEDVSTSSTEVCSDGLSLSSSRGAKMAGIPQLAVTGGRVKHNDEKKHAQSPSSVLNVENSLQKSENENTSLLHSNAESCQTNAVSHSKTFADERSDCSSTLASLNHGADGIPSFETTDQSSSPHNRKVVSWTPSCALDPSLRKETKQDSTSNSKVAPSLQASLFSFFSSR